MKTKTLLVIAGAVGIAYLVFRKKPTSGPGMAQATSAMTDEPPPTTIIQNFYTDDDDYSWWGPTRAGYSPGLLVRSRGHGHGGGHHGGHGHGGHH